MRLAVFLLFAVIALPFAVRAEDTPQPGIRMTVYDNWVWPSDPWDVAPDWEPCHSAIVPMIDFYWDGGAPAETCAADFFLVHFEGWITPSESGQFEWLNWSDDGWRMTLNGTLILNDWNLHGCGGHWSGPNEGYSQLEAGVSYALDVWMFEYGGSACASLWYGSPTNYGLVPAEWYSVNALPAPMPSPEPSPEPTLTQIPEEPSPSPSVAPTPTPEPSIEPTPTEPPPTIRRTPEPTPSEPPPTVAPTQEPTDEPSPQPTSPPTPTATPEPTPSLAPIPPSPTVSPDPTAVPPPEPTQPTLPTVGEAVAAVGQVATAAVEAVTESVAAIGGGIADIAAIGEMGKDLDPAEKEEAQPMAVAVVSSQIASVAAAAANAARTPSGGNLGGGGGGGASGETPTSRKTSSRKEQK